MANEAESDADVIGRMQEQADNFERMVDKTDDRVNDGNNYRGLMNPKDYVAKRAQMAKGEEEVRAPSDAAKWTGADRCFERRVCAGPQREGGRCAGKDSSRPCSKGGCCARARGARGASARPAQHGAS